MTGVTTLPELDWSSAIDDRIRALCRLLANYLPAEQVTHVEQACRFAAAAHAGIHRKSGEPYIFHPLAVVEILQEVRFDYRTLMAAVLHDVIEDTPYGKEELRLRFGEEVSELVDGVSKLTQISFESRLEAQAENFRKMFLAMARDIRVIMIKLADRLHNMRTLDAMLPAKRRRIARETLDIYAPIANRLGMNHLRLELEDLGFRHLHPYRYHVLCHAMQQRSARRSMQIIHLEAQMCDQLRYKGINARVSGREKPLWRVYRSLCDKRLRFGNLNDVYSVRVVTDDSDACYRALGCLHQLYKPLIGRFRDYIALPKANGYQSLHTVLFGPQGLLLEVRIRTRDMHIMAQTGVASYWLQASSNQQSPLDAQERARDWLKKLLDMQRRAGNSVEFLESVKVDLFPNETFVFTPTGDIIELPRGATAIDFAYAIHSDVGNTCIGAKINNRFVPLRTKLSSGQTVEVIISPTGRPDPAWLSFVVTAKARASIQHYLNHLKHEEAVIIGRRLLENALPGSSARLKHIPEQRLTGLLKQLQLQNLDELLADIGLGRRLAPLIANLLTSEETGCEIPNQVGRSALLIKGTEGSLVHFGKCCRPIPGDHIIGFLSTGRGIVIHRDNCSNVANFEKAPDKWLEVQWEPHAKGDFPVAIRLELEDQRWVFAKAAATISELGANIDTIHTSKRDAATTSVDLVVNVRHRDHLALILRRLHGSPGVLRITRRQSTPAA